MLVYEADKQQFLKDNDNSDIQDVVLGRYKSVTGRTVSPSEIRSWQASLGYMAKVLRDEEIPATTGVAVELHIPQTSKRIDIILTGHGENGAKNAVIIELKQWEKIETTPKDAIVRTFIGGGMREDVHPSYKAWSYVSLLEGFNEAVYSGNISLKGCAYLHNYTRDGLIDAAHYDVYIGKAPLFLKGDPERQKLREFIKRYVKYGDSRKVLYELDAGRIRPSKALADSLKGLIKGNPEFVLVDDQKQVYEACIAFGRSASSRKPRVVLVEGGPGTGKTVLAIQILVQLTSLGLNCKYVSKNAAPRRVYESKLVGTIRKSQFSNFFGGSGSFIEAEENQFDVLIVDEAHRLNAKSGLYGNLGENQINELIEAAKCTIFFIDENQRIAMADVGTKEAIRDFAKAKRATVDEMELASQFRCSGSDGYIAWLDNTLGIRETANSTLSKSEFDFRVFDSPEAMHSAIEERNGRNKARVVAGYCWPWNSKKDATSFDIEIGETYKRRWNLTSDESLWIVAEKSVNEVGCIHTCQGLEVEYIGVIIGPDLIVRQGRVQTVPAARDRHDKTLKGFKKFALESAEEAQKLGDLIVKNTYRTLMTRGMKGCFIFCTDPETAEYFSGRISASKDAQVSIATPIPLSTKVKSRVSKKVLPNSAVLPFRILAKSEVLPFENAVPLLDLKIAAGGFSLSQLEGADVEWIELPLGLKPSNGLFVAQVVGESMNKRIPNGSWCLFKSYPAGTRQGKVVVAKHHSLSDPETGGSFTVKVYSSEKKSDSKFGWKHSKITLSPASSDLNFQDLVFFDNDFDSVEIVAELIEVL
jgi:DUF2075 family protein